MRKRFDSCIRHPGWFSSVFSALASLRYVSSFETRGTCKFPTGGILRQYIVFYVPALHASIKFVQFLFHLQDYHPFSTVSASQCLVFLNFFNNGPQGIYYPYSSLLKAHSFKISYSKMLRRPLYMLNYRLNAFSSFFRMLFNILQVTPS